MISGIDRELAKRHLAACGQAYCGGRQRVESQIAMVAQLQRDGHDIRQSKSLLEQFEQTLALQLETRARILDELK